MLSLSFYKNHINVFFVKTCFILSSEISQNISRLFLCVQHWYGNNTVKTGFIFTQNGFLICLFGMNSGVSHFYTVASFVLTKQNIIFGNSVMVIAHSHL